MSGYQQMLNYRQMFNKLKSIKCSPNIKIDDNGFIIRKSCILHKFLEQILQQEYKGSQCLGGKICGKIIDRFCLDRYIMCADIHKEVYRICHLRGIKI